MRLNEKNVANYATCSSPVDKEGWLNKRGELNKSFQKRWFVLKGNLLYYFDKRGDKEPIGVIILEGATVELADGDTFTFHITFQGYSTRTYVIQADNHTEMTEWMRAISMANYDYMKSMVEELQRQFDQMTQYDSEANFGTGDEDLLGGATARRTIATSAPAVAFNPACIQNAFQKPSRTTFYLENQYERVKTQCLPRSTVPRNYPGMSANEVLAAELKQGLDLENLGLDENEPPPPVPPRSRPNQATMSMFFDSSPISLISKSDSLPKSGSLPRVQSQSTGHSVFHDQLIYIRSFREMHEEFGVLIVKKISEYRLARDQKRMKKPMPALPTEDTDVKEGVLIDLH
ncbi:uncharacterized protein [Ptychodera flava]|uniref:uncharacterized protein n=1 Tax=Ptychodera flava TaxID=63121 RepID=UPI00396A1ED6